jgi:hypothetical protein
MEAVRTSRTLQPFALRLSKGGHGECKVDSTGFMVRVPHHERLGGRATNGGRLTTNGWGAH